MSKKIKKESKQVASEAGLEPCDDCAICRAMALAEKEGRELDMNELLTAFEEQGR
ncbi:MAG: hypothetical protein Q7S57_00710 [bacterium]|nr:hypothetical protein [bacterium]